MSALGHKRTCAVHKPMSAKCQKRTLPELFDDFVSASKEPLWHFEAKRFSRLKIYGEFVLGWRLHWKVTRFLALKDAIDVVGPGTKGVDGIGAIRNEFLRPLRSTERDRQRAAGAAPQELSSVCDGR